VPAPVITNGAEFPSVLDYLWGWFQEISLGLSPTGFAPPVVTWEAVRAWQALMDIGPIEPWEVRTLVQLGMVRASVLSEKTETDSRRNNLPPPPTIGSASRRALPAPTRRLR
jgi:hypothetical protein